MRKFTFKQVFPWVLVMGGIIGLLAASILTIEKIHLAADPSYLPSCSLSPVVACSPVMSSWQANTFGFPNMLIGSAGFAMVWAVGMVMLAGANNLKKWFWWCFQAGTVFGMGFIAWLIYSSLYDIGKLCIYCVIVWAVTIPIFWTTLAYNTRQKHFKLPGKLNDIAANHFGKAIAIFYLLIIIVVFVRFSDYFHSLI